VVCERFRELSSQDLLTRADIWGLDGLCAKSRGSEVIFAGQWKMNAEAVALNRVCRLYFIQYELQ